MEKKILLIADDEPTILTAVTETLQDAYQVFTANDGQEVFEVLKKVRPDVILLDIMMPRMSGIEACKKIKNNQETSSIPVMFLTAKGQLTDVEKGFKVGADSYIVKPFSASGLIQKVEAIISKLEMRKKMREEKLNG